MKITPGFSMFPGSNARLIARIVLRHERTLVVVFGIAAVVEWENWRSGQ